MESKDLECFVKWDYSLVCFVLNKFIEIPCTLFVWLAFWPWLFSGMFILTHSLPRWHFMSSPFINNSSFHWLYSFNLVNVQLMKLKKYTLIMTGFLKFLSPYFSLAKPRELGMQCYYPKYVWIINTYAQFISKHWMTSNNFYFSFLQPFSTSIYFYDFIGRNYWMELCLRQGNSNVLCVFVFRLSITGLLYSPFRVDKSCVNKINEHDFYVMNIEAQHLFLRHCVYIGWGRYRVTMCRI